MPASNSIKISITVKIDDEVMTVTDQRALSLSGDRRRWRREIAERVEEIAVLAGTRFAPDLVPPKK